MKKNAKFIDILKQQDIDAELKKSDKQKEIDKSFKEDFMKNFPKPPKNT